MRLLHRTDIEKFLHFVENFLYIFCRRWLKCTLLLHRKAFQQPVHLLFCNLHYRFTFWRPTECTSFQTFIQKPESRPIPVKDLHLVVTPVTEAEQILCQRAHVHLILDDLGVAINTEAKICDALHKIDTIDLPVHHEILRIAPSTFARASSPVVEEIQWVDVKRYLT